MKIAIIIRRFNYFLGDLDFFTKQNEFTVI